MFDSIRRGDLPPMLYDWVREEAREILTIIDGNRLDFSDPGVDEKVWREMQREMENASELRVPVKMDSEKGESWGTCR